jgi:hypothetical protein
VSGVRGARDSDYGGYNNSTSFPLLLDSMPSEYDLSTDNVVTFTGWIQRAVANKMWVIILWHRVDGNLQRWCHSQSDQRAEFGIVV